MLEALGKSIFYIEGNMKSQNNIIIMNMLLHIINSILSLGCESANLWIFQIQWCYVSWGPKKYITSLGEVVACDRNITLKTTSLNSQSVTDLRCHHMFPTLNIEQEASLFPSSNHLNLSQHNWWWLWRFSLVDNSDFFFLIQKSCGGQCSFSKCRSKPQMHVSTCPFFCSMTFFMMVLQLH